MEISIKWNMCRVCLIEENLKPNPKSVSDGGSSKSSVGSSVGSGTNQMKNIFSDTKLSQQILECTGVSMKPNDCMPDKICRKCLMLLKYAVHFSTTCRNSDEYLQSVLQKAKSATSIIKLDKRREATLELMDSIFHENEENLVDDEDLLENERAEVMEQLATEEQEIIGDSLIDKRKTSMQIEKLKPQDYKTIKIKQTLTVSSNEVENLDKHTEDPLEMNLQNVWSENAILQRSQRLVSNDKSDAEDIVELLMEEEEQEMDDSYIEEIEENFCSKQRALPKSTSECSIEDDGYIEDGEEEQGGNTITQDENEHHDMKPLIVIDEEDREQQEECDETENDKYMTSTFEIHDGGGNITGDDADELATNATLEDADDEDDMELFYVLDSNSVVKKESKSDNESDIDAKNTTIQGLQQFDADDGSSNEDDIDDVLLKASRHINKPFPVRTTPSLETVPEYIIEDNDHSSQLDSENNEPNSTAKITTTIARKTINIVNAAATGSPKAAAVTIKVGTRRTQLHTRKKVGDVYVYVCDICGNQFTNRNLMNYHMRIHRNEKNYECELCFKRFSAACNLTAHMRIHTGEKPYECQFCKRRFTDRSTHIKHERIHTNERPFQCNICGKAFSLSTTLRAHEKIHSSEKPYKCEPCSKSFKLPHQLKAHLKTHLHNMLTTVDHNLN